MNQKNLKTKQPQNIPGNLQTRKQTFKARMSFSKATYQIFSLLKEGIERPSQGVEWMQISTPWYSWVGKNMTSWLQGTEWGNQTGPVGQQIRCIWYSCINKFNKRTRLMCVEPGVGFCPWSTRCLCWLPHIRNNGDQPAKQKQKK